MKRSSIFLLFTLLLSIRASHAQNFVWAKTFGSNTYDDWRATAIDASGNVISVGSFSGTVDFDPGPGVFNLSATPGGDDVFIMKMSPSGNLIWAKRIGSTIDEVASDVITDGSSNIYVVGSYFGTVDFDPNAGVFNLSSVGNSDCYILKLNSSGSFIWAKSMGGISSDWVSAIDLDQTTNDVYVSGTFLGTADFDPSAATSTLTVFGLQDIFIAKYDVNGNYVWASSMGGAAGDYGGDVKVSASGANVYTTGQFSGTNVDLSPFCSCGTVNSLGQSDIYIVKLTSWGGFQTYGILGGTSYDNSSELELDASENLYISGQFSGACDMDPGPLNQPLGSLGGSDAFITKLTSSLNYIYAKQIGGLNGQSAPGLALDPIGNIYITGSFDDVVDFDPGPGTFTSQAQGLNSDCYVLKLSNAGNFMWVKVFGSNGLGDYASDIDLDAQGNIYTIGTFWSTVDFDPDLPVYNITAIGQTDGYIHKLSCTLPSTVTSSMANFSVCVNTATSAAISISSTEPGVNYSWSVVGATGINFSPLTGTASSISFTSSTSFSIIVTASNSCGTTTTSVNNITALQLPIVTGVATPTAVCQGSLLTLNGSGANTYTWSSNVTNNSAFTPSSTNVYSVTGSNLFGCSNNSTVFVSVINNPTISVSGQNIACLNHPNTLFAQGAATYTWWPGALTGTSVVVQPSISTIYTVHATAANGCNNATLFNLSILLPPQPEICIVTTDSLNQYNEIFWDKLSYPMLDSMIIYREVQANIYKRIGSVSKDSISWFRDTTRHVGPANGDPKISTYRYKIQLRDTCGNYSQMSLWHNTVFFTHTGSTFFWVNNYMIEGPVNPVITYSLMVCSNPTVNNTYTLVGTTAGNQNQLNDPNYSIYQNTADWRVEADLGYICHAQKVVQQGKSTQVTRSNISNNRLSDIGVHEENLLNSLSVYPNPAQHYLHIRTQGIPKNADLKIHNTLGQVVYESATKNEMDIDVSNLPKGLYTITLVVNNAFVSKKLIIN